MRHGPAIPLDGSVSEYQRPLTPEGVSLVQAVGYALARLGLRPDAILHSPLVRTRETAAYIAAALNVSDRLSESHLLEPGFDLNYLRYLLKEHAGCESLFLVGHTPDMANLIHALTQAEANFAEGTVAHIK